MLNAYDKARLGGFIGTLLDFQKAQYVERGMAGAIDAGFKGSEGDLQSLMVGESVEQGWSAYDVAKAYGFKGSAQEWIQSLNGLDGQSAYEFALSKGFDGSADEWIQSLQGKDGLDAYQVWLSAGQTGEKADYFEYLRGPKGQDGRDGVDGLSAYEVAVKRGFSGSELQWLASLKGKDGTDGADGETPEHEWRGTELRFRQSDGQWGPFVDLRGSAGAVNSSGGGSLSIQKFYDSFAEFPDTGKTQVLYFDKSTDPFTVYIWDGVEYKSIGGGGGESESPEHNELDGRSNDDAHPISSITGLREELDSLVEAESPDHNELNGRSSVDAHPISSITGLREELDSLVEAESPDHNELNGRSSVDAHPISSITGLREELDSLVEAESPDHNELNGRSSVDAHPISSITGLQEVLDNLGNGNGNGGSSSSVRNLQATLIFNLIDDVQVQNGEEFDLTPNAQVGNSFGSLLVLDTQSRVINTFNTGRLNLGIDAFLQLSSGALVAYDIALQRANETTIIERTKRQIFRRPTRGSATGGPTGVTLSSFTSGVTDPFNVVGFKITFLNTSGQTITIEAGEIRIDIFSVYDLGIESPQ